MQVHHSAEHSAILVDLPGGQVSLLKDGLYTFNAESNTVRVLGGEAEIEKGSNGKPIKIKEDHQLSFAAGPGNLKSVDADPEELRADLIQSPRGEGYGNGYMGGYGDGYAPYPYGYAAYPYWGYPYYYPYVGFGFGYWGGGGFYRGGYRGGFGRR